MAISADSDFQPGVGDVKLYRYLRKVRVVAKVLYIVDIDDKYALLTVDDGKALYTNKVERERIDRMYNSGGVIYEMALETLMMFDMTALYIGRVELIVQVNTDTKIKTGDIKNG